MTLFIKNLLFTVLGPGTVAVYVPYRIISRTAGAPIDPAALIIATPLMVLGAAIYLWCLWHFAVTGRGTPAPIDPPKQLVVRGLYRYVRNPIYVGVLMVIAGWAVLFPSRAILEYALGVALAFHLFVVFVEEPQLRGRFGASYEAYCRTVPRWVPRRVSNAN